MVSAVSYPTQERNYCLFDMNRVNFVVQKREKSLPMVKQALENPTSEAVVIENLYALNLMLDNGVSGVENLYPVLSKYNRTQSPNVQVFLAGIYRKTKIPDAFGPLVSMLINNSIHPCNDCNFDPNEEIGGAILNYLV